MERHKSKHLEQALNDLRDASKYATHYMALISGLLNAERCDKPVYLKSLEEHEKYKQIMANRCDICSNVIVRPYPDDKVRNEFEKDRLHLCCRCTDAFLAVRASIRCRGDSIIKNKGKEALNYLNNAKRIKPSYITNI